MSCLSCGGRGKSPVVDNATGDVQDLPCPKCRPIEHGLSGPPVAVTNITLGGGIEQDPAIARAEAVQAEKDARLPFVTGNPFQEGTELHPECRSRLRAYSCAKPAGHLGSHQQGPAFWPQRGDHAVTIQEAREVTDTNKMGPGAVLWTPDPTPPDGDRWEIKTCTPVPRAGGGFWLVYTWEKQP